MPKRLALDAYALLLSYIRSTTHFLAYYHMYESINTNTKSFRQGRAREAFFDMAVIIWCRLFGSDKTNQTHWKKIFTNRNLKIGCSLIRIRSLDEFKNRMLNKANISKKEFDILWSGMTKYRNNYIAHHDMTQVSDWKDIVHIKMVSLGITELPDLQKAKKIILSFYSIMGAVSHSLMGEGLLQNHYVPESAKDDMMAELVGNRKHKTRYRRKDLKDLIDSN